MIYNRTLAETYKLASSALVILVLARFLQPSTFVLVVLCITSSNLMATVSNLGFPIWISIKYSHENLMRARSTILVTSFFSLSALIVLSNLTYLADEPLFWNLLIISEFLLAGPIAFENRAILSIGKNRVYVFRVSTQSTLRVLILLLPAIFSHQEFFFVIYFFYMVVIYFNFHLRQISLPDFLKLEITATLKESLGVGAIGFLMTAFDSLPIIYSGLSLDSVQAATSNLVLRISSVANIPTNALANVSLAERAALKNSEHLKKHLLFSITSGLVTVLIITMILHYTNYFENYPDVIKYLWFLLLFVSARSVNIIFGNLLTIWDFNRVRVCSLVFAVALLCLFYALIMLGLVIASTSGILLCSLVCEVAVTCILVFFAFRRVLG